MKKTSVYRLLRMNAFAVACLLGFFLIVPCVSYGASLTATEIQKKCKWYTDAAELRAAAKATGRPVLIFAGKPDCSVCENVWTSILNAEGSKFLSYLKSKQILGYHVDDLATFTSLRNAFQTMPNGKVNDEIFGGKVCSYMAPFMAFVMLDETNSAGTGAFSVSADVKELFGVVASARTDNKTYDNVTAWLTKLLATDAVKKAIDDANGGSTDDPIEDDPIEDDPIEDDPIEDDPVEDDPVESGSEYIENLTAELLKKCKWYTDATELRAAAKATGRPVLIFAGKPGCSICEEVWETTLNAAGTNFLKFMKTNEFLGYRVETLAGFTSLRDAFQTMPNGKVNDEIFGGKVCSYIAPFFAFVKMNYSNSASTEAFSVSDDVANLFGVIASAKSDIKSYANVTKWITKLLASDEVKNIMRSNNGTSGGNNDDPVDDPVEDDPVEDDPVEDDPSDDVPESEQAAMFKWYTDVTDLRKAIKVTGRPVLIFGGKPDCSVCETIWYTTFNAEGAEFENFMKTKKILGYHIENLALFTALRDAFGQMDNGKVNDEIFGGKICSYMAPWFAFIKVNEDNLSSTANFNAEDDVEILFGVVASASSSNKTTENIKAWLDKLMKTNEFQEAFKVKSVPLDFWETASDLGTNADGTRMATSAGVGKYATSFAADVIERSFAFAGKKGQRYFFSVTASTEDGAPTLPELQALSQKLTCKITKDGSSSALVSKTGAGFTALDNGIFFEPTANATYILTLTLSAAPKNTVPFLIRYHKADYDATAGSFSTPLWSGVEKGKWSMDLDAACAQTSPFFMYMGAAAWCPHCVCLERLVMATSEFKAGVAQYPLVMVDNRRRGEVTGPTLLYSDTYAAYARSVDKNADFEKKLASNHEWQLAHRVGGAATIGYPTLLLCKPNGDGTVKIVSRVSPANFPVDTVFSEYATNLVEKMTAMLEDDGEEEDNYADTTKTEIALANETAETGAYIGGFDAVDWRKMTFSETVDWEISVQMPQVRDAGEYSATAVVTLALLTMDGIPITDEVSGTWTNPPVIEYSSDNGDEILAKVSVAGQEDSVVPYELACTVTEIPEYEISFAQNEFNVIGVDGDCEVRLLWKRIKAVEANASAQAKLNISKGSCADENPFVFQAADEINEGTLTFIVKGVGVGCENYADSQDFQIELEKISNCRVMGNAIAKMCVYTLPAFAGYENGVTITKELVQGMAMEPIVLPFFSAFDDVQFIKSSMPTGVSVELVGNTIVISGKPVVSGKKTAKITLIGNGGESAGSIQIAFTTTSLDTINPAAARYAAFTGRILDEDGNTVGIVTLERGTDSFAVKTTGAVAMEETLDDWSLASDNSVTTSKAGVIAVILPPDGKGYGTLTAENKSYDITFRGNVSSVSEDDYLGGYNIYLEADDKCGKYYGFGFLQMQIAADGSAFLSGKLPDGGEIPEVSSQLTLDEENGLVPFFAETEAGAKIAGALRIVPAGQRQEGEGCVSACDTEVAPKWFSAVDDKQIGVTLCGVAYDSTLSVLEQMKGEDGTVFSLNIFTVWDSLRSSNTVIPSGIRKQGLLAGVTIAETADGNGFEVALPDGYALYPGQELNISVSGNGLINGSFKLLKNDAEGTLETVDFCGIFIPYQASCCGEVPPALAYGHFLYEGKSWSILVVPYVVADFDSLKELKVSTNSSNSGINLKTTGSVAGSLRALVSSDGVEALAVDNRNFTVLNTKSVIGKRISAVNVDYGMIAKPNYSFEYNVVQVSLKKLIGDALEATSGWFSLALPEDMVPIPQTTTPDMAEFYVYDAARRVFTHSSDMTAWQPGQAFFVYFSDAQSSIALHLCTTTVQSEEDKTSGKAIFQGEAEDAEEGTVIYWDAAAGTYSATRPTVPAGLRNGVWLKK